MSGTRPLAGRIAIVTGAADGIGRAIALVLAEHGAAVAIVDVDPEGVTVAQAISDEGGRATFVAADVSDPASVEAMATAVTDRLGPADILVNNAAIISRSAFTDLTWDEWRRVIGVNLHGPFLCAKALVPQMIGEGFGRIVNVASGLGVTGGVNASAYATSKGGLIAFTKCLARELAASGVTANVLVPGLSDTGMPRRGQSDEEIRALVKRIPMRRLAQPREVAEYLAFIVGPSCGYVTGQTLFVNGGWFMP